MPTLPALMVARFVTAEGRWLFGVTCTAVFPSLVTRIRLRLFSSDAVLYSLLRKLLAVVIVHVLDVQGWMHKEGRLGCIGWLV